MVARSRGDELHRVRRKLFAQGAQELTDEELLALLGGSSPSRVSPGTGSLEGPSLQELALATASELAARPGWEPSVAERVCAGLELGRRSSRVPWNPGEAYTSSRQVFSHFGSFLRAERRELFMALYLDARHRLLGEREISRGSLVASIVHPREVFRPAVQLAAAAIICVHNHPSGDAGHSPEDIAVTRRLADAGRILGIELLDHVILGHESYVSFVDDGIPPFRGSDPAPRQGGLREPSRGS